MAIDLPKSGYDACLSSRAERVCLEALCLMSISCETSRESSQLAAIFSANYLDRLGPYFGVTPCRHRPKDIADERTHRISSVFGSENFSLTSADRTKLGPP